MMSNYVLIDYVLLTRSWRKDLAALGPCAMAEGQIFSRPARPKLSR